MEEGESLWGTTKRYVVTGGAGFIGSHLCQALIERGDYVTCVDNFVAGQHRNIEPIASNRRFELVDADILDWAQTADLSGVDCVFHQAASKSVVCRNDPERDLMVNAMGTLRLLMAATAAGVPRFVHASTGSVYGPTFAAQDEWSPRNPSSFYGVSKLAGEGYCRMLADGFDSMVILRYFHVIGPRQSGLGVVPTFIRNCMDGEPVTINGTGEQVRSFTSVHDVVKANLIGAEEHEPGCHFYNVASGVHVTIQELAEYVIEQMGTDTAIEYAPWRPGDRRRCDVRSHRIGIEFNKDWQQSVIEAIEWERNK